MRMIQHMLLVIVPVLATGAATIQPAAAQSDLARQAKVKAENVVGQIREACAGDAKSFCGTVTPGDGRMALCLLAHEDKVSDQCVDAFFDAANQIELAISNLVRAASACEPDAVKLCGSVASKGAIVQCMAQNKPNLSTACRDELASIESRVQQSQTQPGTLR